MLKRIAYYAKWLFARDAAIARQLEGGDSWEVGDLQYKYLLKEGLKQEHYLLDIPCGSFRAGQYFIKYLNAGHYHGIDGKTENIQNGIKYVLAPQKLLAKQPKLQVLKLDENPKNFFNLTNTFFHYIWVHALFDHIIHKVIKQTLIDLSCITLPGGRIYATIFLNPHGPNFLEPLIRPRNGSLRGAIVTFPDREYWHHTLDFFEEIIAEIPELKLDACLCDYAHPLGLRMLRFIKTDSNG